MDPPARVLIVEDESITALDVARRLRGLGYEVVGLASSGPRAIEHALDRRPHVVLMDIHLQGPMDGIDTARHIQAAAPIHLPTLHAILQRVCSRPQGDLPR
jgi:two-component system, response regulator PdtaR